MTETSTEKHTCACGDVHVWRPQQPIDIEKIEELKAAFKRAFASSRDGRRLVARDVNQERDRQEARWGVLSYPDGTGRPGDEETARALKAACKANTPEQDNWRDILAEEVGELFAETDPQRIREEVIQVAAVAQAWAEDVDRRTNRAEEADRG